MEDGLPTAALTVEQDIGAGRSHARLASLLAAPILTVDGTPLTGRELVAAGTVSGRWPALEADLRLGLLLCDEDAPADERIDRALREFRYARRLTSGQDFRRWLAERELSLHAVRGAIARGLARSERCAPVPAAWVDRDAAVAALPAEAVCGGALRDCGWWLADRLLALATHERGGAAIDTGRVHDVAAAEAQLLAVEASGEPEDERVRRLARILAADAAHAERAAQVVGADAIARLVAARRLDWLTFELEGLVCATSSVAAEAAMQLREDRTPLAAVARVAELDVEQRMLVLEDAPATLRTALTGATVGDVVGPVDADGSHEVWVVTRRAPPDAADPLIAGRAAAAALDADRARRRAGRVQWHGRA